MAAGGVQAGDSLCPPTCIDLKIERNESVSLNPSAGGRLPGAGWDADG